MHKKNLLIIILVIILLGAAALIIWYVPNAKKGEKKDTSKGLSLKEQEFNASGRAKAITNETDLWQYYDNNDAGFSVKYPNSVTLDTGNKHDTSGEYYLSIKVDKVDSLKGTMGYDKKTALKNIASLKNGEYGTTVDFPLKDSMKVRKVGTVNAQEFLVLSRFEVCNVTFERELYFFRNNYQIKITLYAPQASFIKDLPDYFTLDKENCGKEKMWNSKKEEQVAFYKDLENNTAPKKVQEWFTTFDKIVNTIEFFPKVVSVNNFVALQGKWESTDDNKSVIVFEKNKKTDLYNGKKISEDSFVISNTKDNNSQTEDQRGTYLTVGKNSEKFQYKILKVTDNILTLLYLGRGNILNYKKVSTK